MQIAVGGTIAFGQYDIGQISQGPIRDVVDGKYCDIPSVTYNFEGDVFEVRRDGSTKRFGHVVSGIQMTGKLGHWRVNHFEYFLTADSDAQSYYVVRCEYKDEKHTMSTVYPMAMRIEPDFDMISRR